MIPIPSLNYLHMMFELNTLNNDDVGCTKLP